MSKVIHTCTGCVPIDKSIIDVYVALLSADKSVTEAETARVEAENARIAAETARDLAESSRKSAEDAREATSSADHATAIEDHAVAEADHTTAEADHDTASSDHTSSVEATEAADTATARANAAAAAAEHMVDIHRGPKGDQGNTGSSVDYPYELVNNLTTDDATKGLSAAQGVALDDKISQLGQKVGDNAEILSLDSSSFTGLLFYSAEDGFVSAPSYNPDFDGWIVELREGATYSFDLGSIINVVLTKERPYLGYVPDSFQIINDAFVADGVYKYAFFVCHKPTGTTANINVSSSGIIKDVTELQTNVTELQTSVEELEKLKSATFVPEWTENANANTAIKELYITGGNQNLFVSTLMSQDGRIAVVDALNNLIYDYGYDVGDDITPGVVHKLHTRNGNGNAYIVFNNTSYAVSGVQYQILTPCFNVAYSALIQSFLFGDKTRVKNWCDNADVNLHIEELYIENYQSILGANAVITGCEVTSSGLRLGISVDGITNAIFFAKNFESQLGTHEKSKFARDVYFGSGAISTLYSVPSSDGTIEFCGYVKFRYTGEDYAVSGLHARLNGGLVGDVSHSPTIKKMMEDDRQIVLIGDSHPSYPMLENTLTDIIQGKLHIRAFNLCFGGCTMAWRTQDGSDNYDAYTFVSLVDAIVSRNFANQIAHVQIQDYARQVCDLQRVDITKPMQFLVEYCGNDWTNSIPIGESWVDDGVFDVCNASQVSAKLASLNKSSLLGALNYGLLKLFTNYPKLIQTQILGCSVVIRDNGFDGSNRMRYNALNSNGKTIEEYDNALKQNCRLTGTRWADYPNNGIYNVFAMRFDNNAGTGITQGGSSHNEPTGYAMMAQYWLNLVTAYYMKYDN